MSKDQPLTVNGHPMRPKRRNRCRTAATAAMSALAACQPLTEAGAPTRSADARSAVASVPPTPVGAWTYRALGTEPFWAFDAEGEKNGWTLTRPGEISLYGDVARVEGLDGPPGLAGATLDGVPFRLTTRPGPCSDGMSDRLFAHHATVSIGALTLTGCGGAVLRPATLEGTRWRFLSLGGERLVDVETSFDVHDRAIGARVACNRFAKSGTWAANDRYVGGPAVGTQAGCREADREATLGRLMAGEMRFRFAPDGTVTVTGGGVEARLRRSI